MKLFRILPALAMIAMSGLASAAGATVIATETFTLNVYSGGPTILPDPGFGSIIVNQTETGLDFQVNLTAGYYFKFNNSDPIFLFSLASSGYSIGSVQPNDFGVYAGGPVAAPPIVNGGGATLNHGIVCVSNCAPDSFNTMSFTVDGATLDDFTAAGRNDIIFAARVSGEGLPSTGNYVGAGSGISSEVEVGAVPEPATWGMMLLGFGLVGTGLRRRPSVAPALA